MALPVRQEGCAGNGGELGYAHAFACRRRVGVRPKKTRVARVVRLMSAPPFVLDRTMTKFAIMLALILGVLGCSSESPDDTDAGGAAGQGGAMDVASGGKPASSAGRSGGGAAASGGHTGGAGGAGAGTGGAGGKSGAGATDGGVAMPARRARAVTAAGSCGRTRRARRTRIHGWSPTTTRSRSSGRACW
jgi:hypothetical protein